MTPTEMHIDALMEKIAKLEAENAKYREAIAAVLISHIAEETLKETE